MGFVTLDEDSVSKLLTERGRISLFTKDGLDPSPAFRTFLLQLLIKHRYLLIPFDIYGLKSSSNEYHYYIQFNFAFRSVAALVMGPPSNIFVSPIT